MIPRFQISCFTASSIINHYGLSQEIKNKKVNSAEKETNTGIKLKSTKNIKLKSSDNVSTNIYFLTPKNNQGNVITTIDMAMWSLMFGQNN